MEKRVNQSNDWTPNVQKKRSPFAPRPFTNELSQSAQPAQSAQTAEPSQLGRGWDLMTMYGQGSTPNQAPSYEPLGIPDQPLLSPKADESQQLGPGWDLTKMPWQESSIRELPKAYSEIPGQPLQAKLTVGAADDPYEREADHVAAQVVDQIHSGGVGQPLLPSPGPISRSLKMRRVPEVQHSLLHGGEASADIESAINRSRGRGQPLDAGLQQAMGQAMGADFSQVRVHTGAQADALNQSIQAKAFTTGQDVFFRQGEYQPGSRGGQALIAHELTHVVQQQPESKLPPPQVQRTGVVQSVAENQEDDAANIDSITRTEAQLAYFQQVKSRQDHPQVGSLQSDGKVPILSNPEEKVERSNEDEEAREVHGAQKQQGKKTRTAAMANQTIALGLQSQGNTVIQRFEFIWKTKRKKKVKTLNPPPEWFRKSNLDEDYNAGMKYEFENIEVLVDTANSHNEAAGRYLLNNFASITELDLTKMCEACYWLTLVWPFSSRKYFKGKIPGIRKVIAQVIENRYIDAYQLLEWELYDTGQKHRRVRKPKKTTAREKECINAVVSIAITAEKEILLSNTKCPNGDISGAERSKHSDTIDFIKDIKEALTAGLMTRNAFVELCKRHYTVITVTKELSEAVKRFVNKWGNCEMDVDSDEEEDSNNYYSDYSEGEENAVALINVDSDEEEDSTDYRTEGNSEQTKRRREEATSQTYKESFEHITEVTQENLFAQFPYETLANLALVNKNLYERVSIEVQRVLAFPVITTPLAEQLPSPIYRAILKVISKHNTRGFTGEPEMKYPTDQTPKKERDELTEEIIRAYGWRHYVSKLRGEPKEEVTLVSFMKELWPDVDFTARMRSTKDKVKYPGKIWAYGKENKPNFPNNRPQNLMDTYQKLSNYWQKVYSTQGGKQKRLEGNADKVAYKLAKFLGEKGKGQNLGIVTEKASDAATVYATKAISDENVTKITGKGYEAHNLTKNSRLDAEWGKPEGKKRTHSHFGHNSPNEFRDEPYHPEMQIIDTIQPWNIEYAANMYRACVMCMAGYYAVGLSAGEGGQYWDTHGKKHRSIIAKLIRENSVYLRVYLGDKVYDELKEKSKETLEALYEFLDFLERVDKQVVDTPRPLRDEW